MNPNLILCVLFYFLSCLWVKAQELKSPDENFTLAFELSSEGMPIYSLHYKNTPIVKPSKMGFIIKNNKSSLYDNFEVEKTEKVTFDEIWEMVWGEEREIRNHYNELYILLNQKETNRKMGIRFRLFNDGCGFRYEFPAEGSLRYFFIKEELTQFSLSGNHMAFWMPGVTILPFTRLMGIKVII